MACDPGRQGNGTADGTDEKFDVPTGRGTFGRVFVRVWPGCATGLAPLESREVGLG